MVLLPLPLPLLGFKVQYFIVIRIVFTLIWLTRFPTEKVIQIESKISKKQSSVQVWVCWLLIYAEEIRQIKDNKNN